MNYPDEFKRTLTIQEVSQKLNITKPTLRFWEKEMEGLLVPLRTRGGQRRYKQEHLSILEEIKKLKGEGLSLTRIKEKMNNRLKNDSKPAFYKDVDLLADQLAWVVKSVIYNFFKKENPD